MLFRSASIGVGGREIGYMFGQYKKIRNEFTGVLTGRVLSLGVGLSGGIGSAMTVPLVRLGSRVHFPCSLRQELFSADLRLWVKLEA